MQNLDLDADLPAPKPLKDTGLKSLLNLCEIEALREHTDFSIHFVAGRYHVVFGSTRRVFPDEGATRLRAALIQALLPRIESE